MKAAIKKVFLPLIPQSMLDNRRRKLDLQQFEDWNKNGCPVPPPHRLKQITIQEYQKKYNCTTLIETGTFLGDMVDAQLHHFKKIISIELGVQLYEDAKKRFTKQPHVTIVQGNSAKVLPQILKDIHEPALFWLDGHYSGGITAKGDTECPIFEELDAVLKTNEYDHVILIDDARLFNGEGDYPTIEKLTDYIKGKNEKYQVEVKHDVIRFTIS